MIEKISILLKQDNISYHFATVRNTTDGSLEIAFPAIKENSGISQDVKVENGKAAVIQSKEKSMVDTNSQYYITYHTSGCINYHKMTFQSAFMEPLYDVHEVNTFFMYTFAYIEKAFRFSDEKQHKNTICIDISKFGRKRMDIVLSICPEKYCSPCANCLMISFGLYKLCIEILPDSEIFHFSDIYDDEQCVKIRPQLDKFAEQKVTKELAFLEYHNALYQTEEAIVFPPNGEGHIKIIFCVEMRIPPRLYIKFDNPDFEARLVKKETTHLVFQVFDKRHNRFVKKAEDIKITELNLDAEIYDENFGPPLGYI